jgi:hypothetical protein
VLTIILCCVLNVFLAINSLTAMVIGLIANPNILLHSTLSLIDHFPFYFWPTRCSEGAWNSKPYYVAPAPVLSTAEKGPSTVNKPFTHYGASFLVDSVQSFRREESLASEPHDELSQYLKAGPEPAADIIQWWGVCIH